MSTMLPSEMACASMLLEIGNDPRLKRTEQKASAAEEAQKEEQSDPPSDGNGNDVAADVRREEPITDPGKHDVLCGRGGGTNNHSGNVKFRLMVNEHKLRYLAASKAEKPKVATEVVKLWRAQDPPGRFLSRKDKSRKGPGSVKAEGNVWYDVGNKKAREKASQCLRERTPDVIPFVREIQRQQDILTGQGLLYVEQQMKKQGGGSPTPPSNTTPQPAPTAQPPPASIAQPPPTATLPLQSQNMTQAEVANAFLLGHFATNGFNNGAQQGGSVPPPTNRIPLSAPTLQAPPTATLPVHPSQDMTQAEVANAFLLGQFAANGFVNNNTAASLLRGPTNPFNLSHLATEATLNAAAVNGSMYDYTPGNQNPPLHGFSLSNDTTRPKATAAKKSGPPKKRKRKNKA